LGFFAGGRVLAVKNFLVQDLYAILRVAGISMLTGWYGDRGYDMAANVVFNFPLFKLASKLSKDGKNLETSESTLL
jgi:hypothetical protein